MPKSLGRSRRGFSSSGASPWSDHLLNVVDLLIASIAVIAPLFMGGRGPMGKFVFAALVVAACAAWLGRQCLLAKSRWHWSGAEPLLAAGLVLVVVQLTPLPETVIAQVSPSLAERLPLWSNDANSAVALGNWSTISLAPDSTRGALVVYLAYALLFVLLLQRLQTLDDVERLLKLIAVAAVAMAALGLAQYLVNNGKFLWFYEHPSRTTEFRVKGTFHNQNHFAHFLALGVGPLIWWIVRAAAPGSDRSSRSGWSGGRRVNPLVRQGLIVAAGVVGVAVLLSFSRGGVIAVAIAAATCLGVYFWRKLLTRKSLIPIALTAAAVIGALSIHGSEHLLYKLGTIKDANSLSELSAGRQALWTALVEAIPDFQMAGSGIGSHREIYPSYMQEYYAVEFTHGESGYLPLLLEAGAPGLALMLIGIVFALWWCIRPLLFRDEQSETRDRRVAVAGALLAGICVSAVHSAVDFVWYLSACMSVTVMLVAAACRLTALSLRDGGVVGAWRGLFMIRSSEFSRQTAVALFVGSCFVGGAMVKVGVGPALAAPHWNDYLRLALDDNVSASDSQAERLAEMHRSLSQALAHHPQSPRLNARMGLICLQRFEELQKSADNAMSLALIRDAAQASEFPSQESQNEWLSRAIGENRAFLDQGLVHSQRAVHECPLIGEAYVFLAELSFLETSAPAAKDEYIDQAQRVRPFDAFVQFSLGREALLALDVEKAIEHWKRAFHHDPQIRGQIVHAFAPQVPAKFFLTQFEPDKQGMRLIYDVYRSMDRKEDAIDAAWPYVRCLVEEAQTAEDPSRASHTWDVARVVYEFLGEHQAALSVSRRAVKLDSTNYNKRRSLAKLLELNGLYQEAVEQLEWCSLRDRDSTEVSRKLAELKRLATQPPAQPPTHLGGRPPATPLR